MLCLGNRMVIAKEFITLFILSASSSSYVVLKGDPPHLFLPGQKGAGSEVFCGGAGICSTNCPHSKQE